MTGRGARVMLIDDPHKDFVEAHSATERQRVWDWWLTVAQTRLEPPSLVACVMTRWHDDDLVGRLISGEHEGDPDEWTVVRIPAIAEEDDPLGRAPGDPLLSPLLEAPRKPPAVGRREARGGTCVVRAEATPGTVVRVDFRCGVVAVLDTRSSTGHRRRARGAPAGPGAGVSRRVVGHGVQGHESVRLRGGPAVGASGGEALPAGPDARSVGVHGDDAPGRRVLPGTMKRLIEDKANGTAVLDTLREVVDGLVAVNPRDGKEVRARSITPEVEAGNVLLPHPSEAPWVADLLSELRNFPHDAHDDQVDAMTQALADMRRGGRSGV